jgi:putative FmdB family regulatory protein
VATYEFRCGTDGLFEVSVAMGSASASMDCPVCGGAGVRVYSVPRLSLARRDLVKVIDDAAATSERPQVVSSIPAGKARRRTPMAPADPRLARLPRP